MWAVMLFCVPNSVSFLVSMLVSQICSSSVSTLMILNIFHLSLEQASHHEALIFFSEKKRRQVAKQM